MGKEAKETENPAEQVRKTQKKIGSRAMTAAILISLAFVVFDQKAIAKGLILGTLFSIINFALIGQSIPMMLGKSRTKARMVGLSSILCRYALLAIPLIVAVKSEAVSFLAVVIGIFSVQMVALLEYTVLQRFKTES